MTEFLLPGESAFCKCTHHVEKHHTRNRLVMGERFFDFKLQEYYTCDLCKCDEFRPYKIYCQCLSCKQARDYEQANTKNKA